MMRLGHWIHLLLKSAAIINGVAAEAYGVGERKGGATVAPPRKAVASPSTSASAMQLRRDMDLLAAEKATLQGELKHEKELRQKHQQVCIGMQVSRVATYAQAQGKDL